ncbi:MAG: hypothetical protein R3296_01015 [Oleiphilaceae bacterium]|nr:hypothetical protein [Oleiphilaceae bacterium]
MESLTPDRDELADRQVGQESPPGIKAGQKAGGPGGNGGSGDGDRSGGENRRIQVWLLLLVLVVAGCGGWTLWEQQQKLAELSQDLQQAQSWIRESRLRNARLEGDLAEADQQLSETGSQVQKQLAYLDSEMRKLWVVAHQTNRPAIAEQKKALASLRDTLKDTSEQAAAAQSRADEAMAASETREGAISQLRSELSKSTQRQQSLASQLEALKKQHGEDRDALQKAVDRASRSQKLAMDEIRSRLDRVESHLESAGGNGEQEKIAALSQRLDELEPVVASVDSARSQLTRRFTALSERVDRLAREMNNNQ